MSILSNCSAQVIRKAIPEQADEIFDLFQACRMVMEEEDIFQWNNICPDRTIIKEDILKGNVWCLQQDEKCLGTVQFSHAGAPEYKSVSWLDHKGKVLFIHRLAVHPMQQKQGFARQLMDFAESHARGAGYSSIRLDAYSGHSRVLRLYEQRAFKRRGSIYFQGRSMPYYCYEKMIAH
jgi:GNAT superfamily N-acetyltransferase